MKRLKIRQVAYLSKDKPDIGIYRTKEAKVTRKERVKAIEALERLNPEVRRVYIHRGRPTVEKGWLRNVPGEGDTWIFFRADQADRINNQDRTRPWRKKRRKPVKPPSP